MASPAPQKDAVNAVRLDAAAQKSSGVAVEAVEMRALPEVVRATAKLANDDNHTWRVGAIAEGRIVRVLANPGDSVKPGQVLARLHSHNIHESQADYRKAVAEQARVTAQESYAARLRDRARRLYDLKAGSLEQWEHAEAELKNAQTAVANAKVDVERTRGHLTEFLGISPDTGEHSGDAAHHEDDADAEYIPVKSPAAGIVLTRGITPGTVVTPANDLFIISDLSSLWAIAEVHEGYLGRLRPGMPAEIHVQAYDREVFRGRIGKLGDSFDPTTRTVKVRIDLANPGGRLKPEMYASAEIELGGSQPSLFIAQQAVQEVRGGQAVFVRTAPDRFEVRPVEVGRQVDQSVEVVRGLKAGELVVTRGAFIVKSEYLKASLAAE